MWTLMLSFKLELLMTDSSQGANDSELRKSSWCLLLALIKIHAANRFVSLLERRSFVSLFFIYFCSSFFFFFFF